MTDLIDQTPVDLKALRALVAVADNGSFRGAARATGYTQSAVSHQVGLLERAPGGPLFTRPGGRGAVALTPAGEVAYRRARRILGEVDSLAADVALLQSGEWQMLQVGGVHTSSTE